MWLLRLDRGGLGEGHHQRSVAAEAGQGRVGGRAIIGEVWGGEGHHQRCGCWAGQGRVGGRVIIGEVWLLRQDRGGLGEGHHRRVAAEARQGRVGGGSSSEKCGC